MEEIYNKWQLTELELKKIQPVRFTKEELLDFANYYHKQQLILPDVSQQRELLLAYEKYTSQQVIGKENSRMAKSLVDGFLANNCG